MFKSASDLHKPDPYFSGDAGFIGSSLETLYADMSKLGLPEYVPLSVRRLHDGIRHAYIYSYFSYDLITLAAAQTLPCLEMALRERVGAQFTNRLDKKGKPRQPPMLFELLEAAEKEGLVEAGELRLHQIRNMFAHGSDTVINPPMFLILFQLITEMIAELFAASDQCPQG